jgi:dipeptidase D
MGALTNLTPFQIWDYFEQICQIPRASGKEEKIINYLLDFSKKNNLEYKKDKAGNVIIKKSATPGFENKRSVALQCHLDMVCEKNSEIMHNFDTDAIKPYIDGEWVKAKGTTLGADNGIGIATCLALLGDKNLKHGQVECLFTVDEETGLKGAKEIQPGFLNSEILLNLDSEEEGEITIGCAGGMDTVALIHYETEPVTENSIAFKIKLSGLQGGHSGEDINKGLANSNKLLNRLVWNITEKFNGHLAFFESGNLRNAIAREGNAIIVVPDNSRNAIITYVNDYKQIVKKEFSVKEPNISLIVEEVELPKSIINKKDQERLLNAVYACPHGVIAMSQTIPGLVETSTNLASVKFKENNIIEITTSQRSSLDFSKVDIATMVENVFRLANANVTHSDGYPGWDPNTKSDILNLSVNSYKALFNKEPKVKAIHAGLECGLFLAKYPYLDMISIGPTITGPHSPDEQVHIGSVSKFWIWLLDILQNVPLK